MSERPFAVLGVFDSADQLMRAVHAMQPKQLGRLEAYTPYPVHGLDAALGLRRSPLGGMVLVMGIVGTLTAFGFQYWASAIDYPVVTGGKPPWSWEAFVPIVFELMVLFATFTAGLGMLLLLNRLPFFGHPVLASPAIKGITRDRFALTVEPNPELDLEAARAAFAAAGARDVEILPALAGGPLFTSEFILRSLTGVVAACVVAGVLTYWAMKLFPVLPPMVHMLAQPRLSPQQPSSFFADGRGMRNPATHTIARGHMPLGVSSQEEAAKLVNPIPRTAEALQAGGNAFKRRCVVCHGPLATGTGSLTAAYGAKPANLQAEQYLNMPDGKIYWVIANGKNAMPSQASALTPDERWAVIDYLRALQRAQNALDSDVAELDKP